MRTVVVIRHESSDALKRHRLWALLMSLFLVGGSVEVEEISVKEE